MEPRNSKNAHQAYNSELDLEMVGRNGQSKSDDSAFLSSPKEPAPTLSSKEATQAYRQKQSSGVPAQGVEVQSNNLNKKPDVDRGHFGKSTSSSTLERSTLELLQNLTSIIMHTRGSSTPPPTSSLTRQKSSPASLETMTEIMHQSISSRELLEAARAVSTLQEESHRHHYDPRSGTCIAVDRKDDCVVGDFQASHSELETDTNTLDAGNRTMDSSDDKLKTGSVSTEKRPIIVAQEFETSSDVDDSVVTKKSECTLPLVHGQLDPGTSSCHNTGNKSCRTETRKVVDTSDKSTVLEGSQSTRLLLTDSSEHTIMSNQAKRDEWTYSGGGRENATSALSGPPLLLLKRGVDLATGANQPQKGNQRAPQLFNLESPQEFRQRSEQTSPSRHKSHLFPSSTVAVLPSLVDTSSRVKELFSDVVDLENFSVQDLGSVSAHSPCLKFDESGAEMLCHQAMSVKRKQAVTDSNQFSKSQLQGHHKETTTTDSEDALLAQSSEEAMDSDDREERQRIDKIKGQRRSQRKKESGSSRLDGENRRQSTGNKTKTETKLGSNSKKRSRDVNLKTTQARKILAKSKAAVSLRQRQTGSREIVSRDSDFQDLGRGNFSSSQQKKHDHCDDHSGSEIRSNDEREGSGKERETVPRKSLRKSKGKRVLYISDDELSDEEFTPSRPKRRKKTASSSHSVHDHTPGPQSHTSTQNVCSNQQPMGDFLAKILTDIPEVDICPLTSLTTTIPTSSLTATTTNKKKSKPSSSVNGEIGATTKQHHSKSTTPRTHSDQGNTSHQQPEHVTETPKWSPNQNSKTTSVILPHLHDLKMRDKVAGSSNSNCPSPEVGMQNRVRSLCRRDGSIAEDRVLEDSDESRTHFRVLMSWESDYLRGSKATRGPILYVMENMPEQLKAIKGPWMNKAKFIWTTWRHKVSPKTRKIYSAMAKENRKELFGKGKVTLNIRRPAIKTKSDEQPRQSLRNADQTQLGGKEQQKLTGRATLKKQQKECSDNRGDQAKSGDTSPSDVSFSSIGSDTINEVCIIREEVNRETQNNSQIKFQYQASNYQWQSQSLPKSDAVSSPKAPPPLPPLPPPLPPHPPCIPVTTTGSAEPLLRQSVEFTKESLKVSVKRTHQLTLASALSSNGKRGSELGATPAVKSGGEKSAAVQVEKVSNRGTLIGKCPTSGTEVGKDSITGSEFDCDTDSFVELVRYSTMTNPLPPISPKYKNPPDISLPTNNNNSSTYSCTESLPSTATSKGITVYTLTSSVSPISTAAQCSITTQTRLNSHPPSAMTGTTNNPFSSWPYQPLPKEPPKPKPTPSSIYRQLVADKKIIPKGNKKKSRSKTSQKPKKSPPSPSASKHAQVSSKSSTREGLSSKLRAPLCATFPTFVIPQFPMGGSNDPGLLVSPVWLGPGSLSGMMPTVTPPNAPPITSNSNNWSQSGGPYPSMSTGSDSTKHGSLSSSSTALPQELATRSGQISPLEFGSSQVRSFHSQTFPGITLIPCELPLKASTSSTVPATTSSVGQTSNHPVSLPNSTATATTVSSARSPASDKHKKSSRKSNRTQSKSSTFVYKPDGRQSSVSTAQAILPSMWNASTQTTQNSTSFSSSPATPYGPWTSNMPQSQDNTRASASQARSSSAWTANRLQSQSGASVSATHAKSSSPWIARTCMPQPQISNNSLSMSQVNSSHVWSASTQTAQIGTSLSARQSKATSPWTGSVQQPHVSISLSATQARSSGSLTSVTTQSQTGSITSVTQAKLHSPWTAGTPRTQVGTSLPGSHTTLSSSWTAVMPQAQVSTRAPASQAKVSTVWSASTPTTQAYPSFSVCQAKPNSVWSANMPQPHIDMYPADGSLPLNQSSRPGARKTLSSHPNNEQPQSNARNTTCPSSMVLNAPPISLLTTPMSPPTTRPPKRPGQYRFHSVSSVVSTSSSAVRPTSLTGVRASLKSSSSSSSEATPSFTTSSFSLSAPPGETTAVLSSSSPVSQDVNSMEYRKFILKKVQQWNEQKKKMLQGGAERMKSPLTPSPFSLDEASFKSPTSHDGAFSPTESFSSANPSPKLNSGLTERLPSDSQSLRRSSDPFNSSGGGDNNISSLFGRPKLMTVAPPITFTDTLPSSLASSTASSFEDDKTLLLSPTVPSVVSSAIRMEDVLTASYSSSIVAPSIVVNSAFIGDISSMSRWELEQLYNHHLEKLEQQKKFITFLESHLKKIHKQHDSLSDHKPTQTEVYQRFLSFIVEPDMVPDVPVIGSDRFGYGHLMKKPSSNGAENAPPIHLSEVIKGGTFDRPVLNEKYDFYANFGQCS